jgi:hypothetical protein
MSFFRTNSLTIAVALVFLCGGLFNCAFANDDEAAKTTLTASEIDVQARDIQMKKPVPGFCGNPMAEYSKMQSMYATCVRKSSDLTEAQLDEVAAKRVQKVAQWRAEYKLQHKDEDSQ